MRPGYQSIARQRGVFTMLVAVLLITGVVFILGRAYGVIGTRSVDSMQQLDSTAALVAAESGLQRAEAILGSSATSVSDSICSGITGTYALPRGSFTFGAAVPSPPTCGALGGTPCATCDVSVTGAVGSASRTLTQQYTIGVAYGTAGRGQTVTMVLKNAYTVPAISLFNLAWKRHDTGGGGNSDATYCATGTGCGLQWHVESSNGQNTVGGMGVSVPIEASGLSRLIVQTLSASRDYVEVGGLFPSVSSTSTPTIVGSYWDDKQSHNDRLTKGNFNESTGAVIAGVAGPGACTSAPATYPNGGAGSFQATTCTNWCAAGDTMIFGFSARSESVADQLSSVSFGSGPNVNLTQLVHFPNLDGSTPNASGTTISEIWYAYNQDYANYALSGNGAGATSYEGAAIAKAGATITLSNSISNATSLTMSVASFDTNGKLCVGDTFSSPAALVGNTVSSTPGGTCSSAAGNYGISPGASANVNKNNTFPVSTSQRLFVENITGAFTAGALNTGGLVIGSGPTTIAAGTYYTLSSAAVNQPRGFVTKGANSTTIKLPTGSSPPNVGTRVAVYQVASSPTGSGTFAVGSEVLTRDVATNSFTVASLPSAPLYGATICGGTCAFFDSPSDAAVRTPFTITRGGAGTTKYWGGGFMCLSGVNGSGIIKLEATTLKTGRWQEAVQ